MSVVLCSLLLNEEQWIDLNYRQHRDWPGLKKWIYVHGADVEYAKGSPDMVTTDGFSVDNTREILDRIAKEDDRVTVIHHGWMRNADPAKGKIEGRSRYLEEAAKVKPEFLVCMDLDEFYTHEDQRRVPEVMRSRPKAWCFTFPKREIWHPPSLIHEPLLKYEVIGGFWGIACCHWWRWTPGLHYNDCHNIPSDRRGRPLNHRLDQLHELPDMPQMLHLGFAAMEKTRRAKNNYYAGRGEAVDPQRAWYVESRACWQTYQPGDRLPRGARVALYDGPVPECFKDGE